MIKFGTDGIRGIYGKDLTDEIAFLVGKALGLLKSNCKVLIATDTRISGKKLKNAVCLGLINNKAKVLDIGISTTPSVAFLTAMLKCDFGVMITASHNSFEYNGIKVFNKQGLKIDVQTQQIIEQTINKELNLINYEKIFIDNKYQLKNVKYARKHITKYIDFLKNQFKTTYFRNNVKIKLVVDCANGSSYQLAKDVFNQNFLEVVYINSYNNGKLINKDCGATSTQSLGKAVVLNKADFGFAFDGDADRFVAVNKKGENIDGDILLLIYGLFLKKQNLLNNNVVVGNKYTNKKLKEIFEKHKICLKVTGVGDALIMQLLNEKNYSLGGENSGHYIFKKILLAGDGILSAIIFLNCYVQNKKLLKKLLSTKLLHCQNIKVKIEKCIDENFVNNYENSEEFKSIYNKYEKTFKRTYYFLRKSGTEPVIRINVQGKKLKDVLLVTKLLEQSLLSFKKK